MRISTRHQLSRRGFCLCCLGATAAASGNWLTPREVFAQASGIVDMIRSEAAKAKIAVHRLRVNVSVLEGSGGNIAVLTGQDGKLLVDAGITASKPRILIARAEVARDVVPDALRAAGCEGDGVSVYKTRPAPRPLLEALAALLEAGEIDVVTFTSSSTVEHLCDALEARAPALLRNACVASIGPITTETARKRGLRVDVTASEHTIPGLVAAIEGYFDLATTGTRTDARL